MSQVYNTGPCELYVGSGDDGTLEFLGYSEQGMNIQERESFEDVHADLLGPRIPIDVQHFQADAMITGDLIRWNEAVLQKIEDRSRNFVGTQVAGLPGLGEVGRVESGALMLAQGKTYRLLCDAPNVGLPVFPDMEARNFLAAYLADVLERRRGARVERVHVIFRALSDWTNIGATAALPFTKTLWNNDRSGRPAASPN